MNVEQEPRELHMVSLEYDCGGLAPYEPYTVTELSCELQGDERALFGWSLEETSPEFVHYMADLGILCIGPERRVAMWLLSWTRELSFTLRLEPLLTALTDSFQQFSHYRDNSPFDHSPCEPLQPPWDAGMFTTQVSWQRSSVENPLAEFRSSSGDDAVWLWGEAGAGLSGELVVELNCRDRPPLLLDLAELLDVLRAVQERCRQS